MNDKQRGIWNRIRNMLPRRWLVILAVGILLLLLLLIFLPKILPNNNPANLYSYYGISPEDTVVFINTERAEMNVLREDEQIYLPLDAVVTHLNQRFYYDSESRPLYRDYYVTNGGRISYYFYDENGLSMYFDFGGMAYKGMDSNPDIEIGVDMDVYIFDRNSQAEDIEEAGYSKAVIATYKIENDAYTDEELEQTVSKMFERAKAYCKEWNYSIEDDRITFEIPMDTENVDVEEILKGLAMSGELLFLDEENYDAWTSGQAYEAILTGEDVESAVGETAKDSVGYISYDVLLSLSDEGAEKFADATTENMGKKIYIICNGEEVSAPIVNTPILNGQCVITGLNSLEEAQQVAVSILSGDLPLGLTLEDYEIAD